MHEISYLLSYGFTCWMNKASRTWSRRLLLHAVKMVVLSVMSFRVMCPIISSICITAACHASLRYPACLAKDIWAPNCLAPACDIALFRRFTKSDCRRLILDFRGLCLWRLCPFLALFAHANPIDIRSNESQLQWHFPCNSEIKKIQVNIRNTSRY